MLIILLTRPVADSHGERRFQDESLKMAIRFDDLFRKYDYIVGPSASCVAFVKENHPGILKKEGHVCQSAGKIYDLCDFIHDVIKPSKLPARFPHKVSIHNSCHGVRELFNSAPSELNILITISCVIC